MAGKLDIRPARVDDLEALLTLYQNLSSDNLPCPPDMARKNLARLEKFEGSAILVGIQNDALVTSCTVIVVPNLTRGGASYAVIENVVTDPDHRGQGLGKQILKAASDRAWRHGCYKVMLSTGSRKPAVLAFYEAAGFEQSRTGFQMRRHPARSG